MQSTILESRPLYAIGTVARLTGLKPDTLRVWERRYGLGASHKSSSGRRQYTQADLEHLQLVAALVNSGVRIGEIASAGRKTLEVLLRRTINTAVVLPERKPRVLVIGGELCQWLDEHQGCLSHVDASLARVALVEAEARLAGQVQQPDLLVIGCDNLAFAQVEQVRSLASAVQAGQVLVSYKASNQRWLQAVQAQGVVATTFPPDPGFLSFELSRCAAERAARQGNFHLGELVAIKPRQFSEQDLNAAAALRPVAEGDSRGELAELVRSLAHFEHDLAAAPVDDWSDAAVRACAYAYAGQARWLMEKALQVVLAGEQAARESKNKVSRGRLHDAA